MSDYGYTGIGIDGAGARPTPAHTTMPQPDILWRWPGREGLTFNRGGTNAFYRDSDGVLQAVQDNDEMRGRHHYRDRNGVLVPAALVEPSRTNSILDSEDFSSGNWSSFNQETITADQSTAPDGTTTADLFEGDVDGVPDGVSQSVSVSDDSLARAASWFVKAEDNAKGRIRLEYIGGTTEKKQRVVFQGIDGDDPSLTDVDGNADRFGIEEVGDGWWRVWVVVSNNGTGNTTARMVCFVSDENTSSHGIYGWGAQLEGVSGGASYPTSYIPTTSSAVTRSAEQVISPFFADPQALSIYLRMRTPGADAMDSSETLNVGDSSGNNRITINAFSGNDWTATYENNSGTTASSFIDPGESFGDELELLVQFYSDGAIQIHSSVNGGSVQSGTKSGAVTVGSSFANDSIVLNGLTDDVRLDATEYRSALIAAGVQPLSVMRGLAETPPEFGR